MAFNGLCSVSGPRTLEVLGNPSLRQRLLAIMQEVMSAAAADGAQLEPGLIQSYLEETEAMASYAPSMHSMRRRDGLWSWKRSIASRCDEPSATAWPCLKPLSCCTSWKSCEPHCTGNVARLKKDFRPVFPERARERRA